MSINFIFALSFINGIAAQAARLVLPLFALALGASPLTVGVLGASFALLSLLLSLPAGRIADRFGSRWLLVAGALAGGVSLIPPYFAQNLTAIFVAAMITGLGFGIYNVSLQNLVGVLSPPEKRTRNFSNYSLANSGANFIAPLIAGFSAEHFGNDVACLFLAFLITLPAAALLLWGKALPRGARREKHATTGIRSLLSDPGIKKSLAVSSLLLTGQDLYRIYMPVYGSTINLSASAIGIILSGASAAAFVVRLVLEALIKRYKEERLLANAFYVTGACLILIPLLKSEILLVLVSFIFGLGMGCCQPIITMLMFSTSPPGRSGETMGLRMTVIHLTRLTGPVVFGAVGTMLGLISMFWLNALMMGTGGWLSKPSAKHPHDKA